MLYGKMNLGLLVSAAIFSAACSGGSKKTAMGTYAYDRAFFAERGIETLELTSEDGASRVLVIPAYQVRLDQLQIHREGRTESPVQSGRG